MYSGSIHDGTLLHSKSQYTTVKHSRKLFEHTYMSDLYGLGTPTPIEFFRQDLLWRTSNTHSHSCSQKASKPTSVLKRPQNTSSLERFSNHTEPISVEVRRLQNTLLWKSTTACLHCCTTMKLGCRVLLRN
jgi:hypothetical protein